MALNSEGIRAMALAIIKNEKNQILVSPGYDKIKNESFYRLLGGGVDFKEYSEDALKREFQEELNAELTNCKLLGVVENIFTYDGLTGHEICFIYSADFVDAKMYEQSEFKIIDSKDEGRVIWLDETEIKNSKIYPDVSAWL
jgi:ADP-ribose pyrophosphatase YjhB (NUDIX family)